MYTYIHIHIHIYIQVELGSICIRVELGSESRVGTEGLQEYTAIVFLGFQLGKRPLIRAQFPAYSIPFSRLL